MGAHSNIRGLLPGKAQWISMGKGGHWEHIIVPDLWEVTSYRDFHNLSPPSSWPKGGEINEIQLWNVSFYYSGTPGKVTTTCSTPLILIIFSKLSGFHLSIIKIHYFSIHSCYWFMQNWNSSPNSVPWYFLVRDSIESVAYYINRHNQHKDDKKQALILHVPKYPPWQGGQR